MKIPNDSDALSILEHFREALSRYQQTRNQAEAVVAEKLYKQVEFICKVVGLPLTAKWTGGMGGGREYEPLREWKTPHFTASAIALVEKAIREIKAGNYDIENWIARGQAHMAVGDQIKLDEQVPSQTSDIQTVQSTLGSKPEVVTAEREPWMRSHKLQAVGLVLTGVGVIVAIGSCYPRNGWGGDGSSLPSSPPLRELAVGTSTPCEIVRAIENEPAFDRRAKASSFTNKTYRWPVEFDSVFKYTKTGTFKYECQDHTVHFVSVKLSDQQLEDLGDVYADTMMWIKGVLVEVEAPSMRFLYENATIEFRE